MSTLQISHFQSSFFFFTCTSVPCDATYENRCFLVVHDKLNWNEARDSCIAEGGRLAEVDTEQIQDELQTKAIGMIDIK